VVAAAQLMVGGEPTLAFVLMASHRKEKGMPPVEVLPSAERSAHMRKIKSKNTKPELLLSRALRRAGLNPKRHDKLRPGKPDFAFCRKRVAVFVDGDFWHGLCGLPKTNTEWWAEKFRRNVERDERQTRELQDMGWLVLRYREKDVNKKGRAEQIAAEIKEALSCR
jgi:DNA mismatch endonuclease (patch repair protein)